MRCLALGSSQFSLWGGLGWPGHWARRVGVAVQVLPPEVGVARSVPGQGVGVAVHALPPEVGVALLSAWARRVGVAIHALPPEVGVALLSAWASGWTWLSMSWFQR